jgi:hypothetical protein
MARISSIPPISTQSPIRPGTGSENRSAGLALGPAWQDTPESMIVLALRPSSPRGNKSLEEARITRDLGWYSEVAKTGRPPVQTCSKPPHNAAAYSGGDTLSPTNNPVRSRPISSATAVPTRPVTEAAFELVHDHEMGEQGGNLARVKVTSARHWPTDALCIPIAIQFDVVREAERARHHAAKLSR